MPATMKNLVIRPADVSLNPLGEGSNVADARVSVVYDRDVWANGQPVPRVPLVSTSIPTAGRMTRFFMVLTCTLRPRRRRPQ